MILSEFQINSKYLKNYLLLIFVLLYISQGFSQARKPFVENYNQKAYGVDCNSSNASVLESEDGIMYFGNYTKVISFDGVNWEKINITPSSNYITSLAEGFDNRIYIGALNEFGYIDINAKGEKSYFSISDSLKIEDKNFGAVWQTFKLDSSIIFFTQKQIYVFKNNKIKIIKPIGDNAGTFHNAFVSHQRLFVRQRNLGLLEYRNNQLILVSEGEKFKDIGVFGILYSKSEYIIVTQEKGLFIYSPKAKKYKINPIISTDNHELISSLIFGAKLLKDGNIALNTQMNGLLIISKNAKIIFEFNQKTGLLSNDIKSIYQDNYRNLWLATANGISFVNYASPVSFFNEESGLYGSVSDVLKYNNQLYVATSRGLFVQTTKSDNRFFKRIEDIDLSITDLCISPNGLLIGTKEGLFQINKKGKLNLVASIDARKLIYIYSNNQLLAAGLNGVYIYQHKNKWVQKKYNNEIAADITTLSCLADSSNNAVIWIGTKAMGVYKVQINKNSEINYEWFIGEEDGLDEGWTKGFIYNDNIYFSTFSGVKKYKTKEEIIKQTPANFKADIQKGSFENYYDFKVDSFASIQEMKQINDESYAIIDNKIMYSKNSDSLSCKPFKALLFHNYNNLFIENESRIWIGTKEGLIAFDNNYNREIKPSSYIRKILTLNDSNIYKGLDTIINFSLDYSKNTLEFIYSSLYQQNSQKLEYSYILEGADKYWSNWSEQNKVKYQNLHEGSYTFKLKAKNRYNIESNIRTYSFTIETPWFRTIWAMTFYILIFILIIIILVRLYTARLKAKNIHLEKIVEERTLEIVKQKDEIMEIHHELKDSINYAERIQLAVLPSKELIDDALEDHFILFKPKDVVSGDYYWAHRTNQTLIITVADCTGHGVPGAFMSMLGMSFLNQIVNDNRNLSAADILNELRKKVIFALKQKGISGEQKDGMDMSLCVIDLKTNKVQWSGANNPLYIISKSELNIESPQTTYKIFDDKKIEIEGKTLYELKPDKMPVAHYLVMNNFQNNVIYLSKGDQLYMFSDGYADQFGGIKGKKYKYKPFKRLILNNSDKGMPQQGKLLDNSIEEWKSGIDELTQKPYEQIDDICVIGIKI